MAISIEELLSPNYNCKAKELEDYFSKFLLEYIQGTFDAAGYEDLEVRFASAPFMLSCKVEEDDHPLREYSIDAHYDIYKSGVYVAELTLASIYNNKFEGVSFLDLFKEIVDDEECCYSLNINEKSALAFKALITKMVVNEKTMEMLK